MELDYKFIKTLSDILEIEMNEAVKQYLHDTYPQYRITETPLKNVMDPYNPNNKITDLDGVYILTSEEDASWKGLSISLSEDAKKAEILRTKTVNRYKRELSEVSPDKPNKFVIIEAKHKFTRADFEEKLDQITKITELLKIAKDAVVHPRKYHKKFVSLVNAFSLDKMDDEVWFFMGSAYTDKDLDGLFKEYKDKFPCPIWRIQVTGARFSVKPLVGGGSTYKNKTLPNEFWKTLSKAAF